MLSELLVAVIESFEVFSDIFCCFGKFRRNEKLSLCLWALLICSVALFLVVGSFHAIRFPGCSSGQC